MRLIVQELLRASFGVGGNFFLPSVGPWYIPWFNMPFTRSAIGGDTVGRHRSTSFGCAAGSTTALAIQREVRMPPGYIGGYHYLICCSQITSWRGSELLTEH
jgi:hypothetical protein